ncbi:MAG: response regulator [Candidatus Spechtbacteria bacterium]|nr:response regulator [Candidatus Spechtbacteria bacterium]
MSEKTDSFDTTKSTAVLVVEDDQFLRDLIVHKLIEEGFTVFEAIDGEEGLNKALNNKPQIILLDIILPGIDGFEVLRQLKQKKETENIPVIVLSNLGQEDDVERARALGAKDYLVKAQFTPAEIIEKIKKDL